MNRDFYISQLKRVRPWTPIKPTEKQNINPLALKTIQKALALSKLELPVGDWCRDELSNNPNIPSEAVKLLNIAIEDEVRHDIALANLRAVCDVPERYDAIADQLIDKANALAEKVSPITVAGTLEASVFFVILPIYRFLGTKPFRTTANDISLDENRHSIVNVQIAADLGYKRNSALNKLRRATVAWLVSDLPYENNPEEKYLSKQFWLNQSDSLYERGKAKGLADTKRGVMYSFFEASNSELPTY